MQKIVELKINIIFEILIIIFKTKNFKHEKSQSYFSHSN